MNFRRFMPPASSALLSSSKAATRAVFCAVAAIALLACGLSPAADIDDPTRGDVVLFPAPMEELSPATPAKPRGLRGWNMPGRNFRAGEGWWGLVCGKSTDCRLVAMRLAITPTKHEVYQSEPVPSQLLVWSPLPATGELLVAFKPVRTLAGMPLAAGPVKTWLQRDMVGTYPEGGRIATMEVTIPVAPGGAALLLPRLRPAKGDGNGQPEALVLELRLGGRRQLLDYFDNNVSMGNGGQDPVDAKTDLVWAGDLDGDGKLDLLLNTGGCRSKMSLWLSSRAAAQELVGFAGSFDYYDLRSTEC